MIIRTIIIIFIILMFAGCNNKKTSNQIVVAESDLGIITLDEFETEMKSYRFGNNDEKAQASRIEKRREFLKSYILDKIILDISEKSKVDTFKTIRENYQKRLYAASIVNGLVVDSIRNKAFSEEDIKREYDNRRKKYKVRHIVKRNKKNGDSATSSAIDSVYAMLENGNDFSEIAEKYSDDSKSSGKGGDLGWIFSYEMLEEIENEILKLKKNSYSKPFKSRIGYHIVFLEDIKDNPELKEFNKERPSIIKDLSKRNSRTLNKLYIEMIRKLMTRYGVEIDSVNAKVFIKNFNEYKKLKAEKKFNNNIEQFFRDKENLQLSSFENNKISTGSIVKKISKYPEEKWPPFRTYNNVREYVLHEFKNSLAEKYADELGYTSLEKFVKSAKKDMFGQYKQKVIEINVRSLIENPSTEEIKEYYETNKNLFKNNDGGYKELMNVKVSIENALKSKKFKKKLLEWEKKLLADYNVIFNHSNLERSFYYPNDGMK